jgi:hypothetical protein
MCLVVIFTITFKHTIFCLLQVIEPFYYICSDCSLWWPFSNDFAFQKWSSVIHERVIHWKESSMTIKERDFLTVLQPKCISIIHTYWIIQSIMNTPNGKFVICQIIMD